MVWDRFWRLCVGFHLGTSFLGRKCFAFTKLDAGEIRRIKKEAFAATTEESLDVRQEGDQRGE